DVDSGLAYNPASATFGDRDYLLTAPDGTRYSIDSERGAVKIVSAAGTLFVGDSGITALGGASLQFIRDGQGRVIRVSQAGGASIVYQYGADGALASVRDLETGGGTRYGYSDGALT